MRTPYTPGDPHRTRDVLDEHGGKVAAELGSAARYVPHDVTSEEQWRRITARALEQSPNDARILEVRRESAEKIVTEALGLKYAGDRDGAMRLAKLAVELNPDLPTAQRLAAELEAEALASAPTATATAAIDVRAAPSGSAKSGAPKSTGKAALPPSSALPPSKGQPSTVVPAKSGKPNVPPKNTGGPAVLPPTTNTGPWL